MPHTRNLVPGALCLALALVCLVLCGAGCAGFAGTEAEDSLPLPATLVEIRAAIEAERALLLDLVGKTTDDPQIASSDTQASIEIAERLSRLYAALERLEREAESTPTAP